MSQRARNFYLIALAASVAALAWASGEQDGKPNNAASAAAPHAARGVGNFPAEVQSDLPKRSAPAAARGTDPFSARSWEPRIETKSKPSLPETQAEPQAPPLPFVYRGSLTADGTTILVLAKADRDYLVRAGDTLDGTYLVERIEEQRLVLKYLPLGIQQVLPLAAPGASAGGTLLPFTAARVPASGAPPAPGRSLPGPVLAPEHPDPALKEED